MIILDDLNQIINKYDVFLIDQWGVLHDGRRVYSGVFNVLQYIKKLEKKIIIISNSAQREKYTQSYTLKKLGIKNNLYHRVVTSGEVVWKYLEKKYSKNIKYPNKCYRITHLDNDDFFSKLNIVTTKKIDNANFILNSSIMPGESVVNYSNILKRAIKNDLLMICSNPDLITYDGKVGKIVYQAGILAEYYKQKGGRVIYFGKPYKDIFTECLFGLKKINKKRIACIGDSLLNDIKGAFNFKIDSIFVMNGIHKNEIFTNKKNFILEKNLNKLFQKYKIYPEYSIRKLKI